MNDDEKLLPIKELGLLATLLYLKFNIENVDYQIEGDRNKPTAFFHFKETNELKETIKAYWNKQLSVEPNEFLFNIRQIKAQADGVYRNPRAQHNNYSKTNNNFRKKR